MQNFSSGVKFYCQGWFGKLQRVKFKNFKYKFREILYVHSNCKHLKKTYIYTVGRNVWYVLLCHVCIVTSS